MKRTAVKRIRIVILLVIIPLGYLTINAFRIYTYSFRYSEEKSDAAIVLGAATTEEQVSPIFRERINHSMYLYREKLITVIILTGGHGEDRRQSDSEIARKYLLAHGIPGEAIVIEKRSRYTIENLQESRRIIDSLGLKSVLLVTDPLHMKRSVDLAAKLKIDCKPSPTKTTMYRSFVPKAKSLMYEAFYYSLGEIAGKN